MGFYVTTPIFYVNAAPHLGHAYSMIACDILARHHRQLGEEVFFLTGTDEHGEPVALAAQAQGLTPQELADRNAERFAAIIPQLNVTNDFFIRTSDPRHKAKVQEVMQRVHDNGHVYKGVYAGWYCPRCADFKGENEIGPHDTCLIHEIPLVREEEENWFFRLSAFQPALERLYAERPDWVTPRARANEARSFIAGGLQDVSLTRGKFDWGIAVPWDDTQVFYVWFDALLNYYTALSFADPDRDLTDTFWPASLHVLAKDILKFHAVIWPALLLAAELPLPRAEVIHGYLTMNDKKMSKSLGNVLDPFEIIDRFGADALRFYCFREVSFGGDGDVSAQGFEDRYTSELANDYGNLASRTLNMLRRYADAAVPDVGCDDTLGADFDGLTDEVCDLLGRHEITQALERVWLRVRRLNRYVEEQAPWQLAKDPAQADRLAVVLRSLAEGLRCVTVLLHPYMPASTETLLDALGVTAAGRFDVAAARFGSGPTGSPIGELAPLFPKPAT